MLKSLSISKRIILLGASIIVCFSLVLGLGYLKLKGGLYEGKYLKTRHLVESAWGVLDYYAQEAKSGAVTTNEAQSIAKRIIKNLRYENKDYFWINDMTPRMVMHPFKSELDGKDLSDNKDPNGKRLFVAMVELCRRDGAGFVDYY